MKAIILAAGYATRLGELTRDRAKPLLPIADRPMIEYLMDHVDSEKRIDHVYVVTNARFAASFQTWARERSGRAPVTVVDDQTTSDENKLGAIGDILFVKRETGLEDDVFIAAGDNLFDFDLAPFFESLDTRGTTIGLYDVGRLDLMPSYSEVQIMDDGRIVSMIEKPKAPTSTLIAIGLYGYQAADLAHLESYASGGGNLDSPGHFPAWLYRQKPVFGHLFEGTWFDIGSPDQYRDADKEWRALRSR
jgi:glucose-1-phosphate thymidylyltransferase